MSDKRILVTGGAQRVGRAFSEALAADGWHVVIHYNSSAEAAEALAAELRNQGGSASTAQANLADEDETAALVPGITERDGPLDAVINNASTFTYDDWESATKANWDTHMAVHMRAPFLISQAFAHNLPSSRKGCIINMIDQRVWRLTPHFMTYTLSKAGLWTMTRTLAQALAPDIRVNAIGPGPTLPSVHQSQKDFDAQAQAVLLQRHAALPELQAAARFLLASPSVTGQMIAVDGGQHLAWETPDTHEVSSES